MSRGLHMISPLEIVDYAAAHGYEFSAVESAIALYEGDPEYYEKNGLAVLMRHAAPQVCQSQQSYEVRV